MNRIKIKIGTVSILLLLCTTTLIMLSFAFFTSNDSVTNVINLGDVNIDVSEEFTPPKDWNGEDYPKLVKIQNNSKSPALIRVSIIPRWVDEQENAWPGDTNIVTLNYINTIESPSDAEPKYPINTNKWVKGNDGYYYYNTIVPTGDATVEILNSVSANIPENLKNRYKDKKLIVDVKSEAVQATTDAHRKTWSNITQDSDLQKMLDSLCAR